VTIIAVAQDTGTQAVIKSAHLDRLTPRVSRFGLLRILHHLTTFTKDIKKNMISDIKKNHNQCWKCNICKNHKSSCTNEGEAINGSG
jgi:hypothetical protein